MDQEGLLALGLLPLTELKSVWLISLSLHRPELNGVLEVLYVSNSGTCVNVGCIPKKLFHHVSTMGEHRNDMNESGWTVDNSIGHKW